MKLDLAAGVDVEIKVMRTGLMAKKLGMTRVFDQNRKHNSVTVLEIPSTKVLKLRKNR